MILEILYVLWYIFIPDNHFYKETFVYAYR